MKLHNYLASDNYYNIFFLSVDKSISELTEYFQKCMLHVRNTNTYTIVIHVIAKKKKVYVLKPNV